jgi:hypothetical protein
MTPQKSVRGVRTARGFYPPAWSAWSPTPRRAVPAAESNGGLSRAAPPEPSDNLSRLMRMWEETDAREYQRYQRGVRHMYEGQVLTL